MWVSGILLHYHSLITAIAAIAATVLSIEFVRVVKVRRSSYPWGALATSAVLGLVALKRFTELIAGTAGFTANDLLSEYPADIAVMVAAMFIPMVRSRSYTRLRFGDLKTTNARLTYTKQLFEEFMDRAPAFASIRDVHLRWRYMNLCWTKLLGHRKDELIGHSHLPPNLPTPEAKMIDRKLRKDALIVLRSRKRKTKTFQVQANDSACTYLVVRFPIQGPNNEPLVGSVGIDITDRLARRARIASFASLIQLSPDAIYYFDQNGIVQFWNQGAEIMLNTPSKDVIGLPIWSIFPTERQQDCSAIIEKLDSAQALTDFETEHICKDRGRRLVSLSAVRLSNPMRQGAIYACIGRDITERRAIENHIIQLNRELESQLQELSALNENLAVARDQALLSSKLKSDFVANISHELRTPLGALLGISELMLQEELEPDTQDMIGLIHDSASALLYLVNDILNLSKLEAGKTTLDLENFSPWQLLLDCTKLMSPAASRKGIALVASPATNIPAYVCGDVSKIRQVLLRLLDNAIKFTVAGSIVLKIDIVEENDTSVAMKFSVSDTGPGVNPNCLKLLFTPFVSAEQSRQGINPGIGLVLSKRLCDVLGGEIGCESRPGQGATFWFKVKTKKRVDIQRRGTAANSSKQRLDLVKVLSVEDNPLLSILIRGQLASIGVQADTAASGHEAIEKAITGAFDIILMDIHLPDIDGFQAARAIRRSLATAGKKQCIIIAMTAGDTTEDRESALSAGMNDYLCKPVGIDKLRKALLLWLPRLAA
jgi:PAS domain S-box-containing protein